MKVCSQNSLRNTGTNYKLRSFLLDVFALRKSKVNNAVMKS